MLDHTRHSSIFDASTMSVTIVGAGGIGALTSLVLAKMGIGRLKIWDYDTVEDVNIATQWFKLSDIGRLKTDAIGDQLAEFAGDIPVTLEPWEVDGTVWIEDFIVISAVDGIANRKQLWGSAECRWFIDTRMAAEEVQIFTVDMHDDKAVEKYDRDLHRLTDENVPDLPCTEKATIYTAAFAAGYVGLIVRNIIRREHVDYRIVHNLPSGFKLQVKGA